MLVIYQKLRARLGTRKTGLNPPVFYTDRSKAVLTSVVVPYCYLFLLYVFILWFSYYVSDTQKIYLSICMQNLSKPRFYAKIRGLNPGSHVNNAWFWDNLTRYATFSCTNCPRYAGCDALSPSAYGPFLYIIKTDFLNLGVPLVRRHSHCCPANTCLGKSCSLGLPRVPFVNCCQVMYLVISLLVLRAGCGIWLYQFLIIAYPFTLSV